MNTVPNIYVEGHFVGELISGHTHRHTRQTDNAYTATEVVRNYKKAHAAHITK